MSVGVTTSTLLTCGLLGVPASVGLEQAAVAARIVAPRTDGRFMRGEWHRDPGVWHVARVPERARLGAPDRRGPWPRGAMKYKPSLMWPEVAAYQRVLLPRIASPAGGLVDRERGDSFAL